MTEFVCKECGAANPPDARFCGGCDVYLGWDTKPPPPSDALEKSGSAGGADAPPLKDDNPAQAPKVDLPQSEADLPPDTGADLEMRIRNNSTIVDAYGIESAWAPKWLTITHPEIRLMPGESDSVTAHLAIAAGAVVEAQTLTPRLRIYSQRDTSKFVEVTVKLTVPRYGPPLTIRARPPVVRLVNNTSGRVEVTLDNAGSNYPRRAALAASDSEGVVQFRISPPTAVVPPGGHATANVDFNVPAVRDGENRVRQLTISAREEENTAEAAVTVNQERIAAAPLRLRLEPSVLRIRDGDTAEVTVVVDNRGQTPNREVRLQGYDPERTLRFSFAGGAVRVAAGQTTATKVRIVAPPPPPGKEVSRTFSIVASYGADEAQASGTFVQTTSDIPIKAALIRLTPETLKRRDSSYGRFLMSIDAERHLLIRRYRPDHVRMALDGVEVSLLWDEVRLPHEPRVPIRGPPLIHDLRGEHRIEIEGFFAHREEDVPLPAFHLRRVLRHEPEQIALRMRRNGRAFLGLHARAGRGRLELRKTLAKLIIFGRPLVLDVFRIARATQRLIDVDVLFQGEGGIEHGFHALHTVSLYRLLDLTGVVGRVLDDVLADLVLAA